MKLKDTVKRFWDQANRSLDVGERMSARRIQLLRDYGRLRLKSRPIGETRELRVSFNRRRQVYEAGRGICWACIQRVEQRHRHHIIQLQNGGSNRPDNVVPICEKCHEEIHPWLNTQRLPNAAYQPIWS